MLVVSTRVQVASIKINEQWSIALSWSIGWAGGKRKRHQLQSTERHAFTQVHAQRARWKWFSVAVTKMNYTQHEANCRNERERFIKESEKNVRLEICMFDNEISNEEIFAQVECDVLQAIHLIRFQSEWSFCLYFCLCLCYKSIRIPWFIVGIKRINFSPLIHSLVKGSNVLSRHNKSCLHSFDILISEFMQIKADS